MISDPHRAFGLVLNISNRKDLDGKKLSNKIRLQLIDFASQLQGEDSLYLCQLDAEFAATSDGERTALIGNWEVEEEPIDLTYMLEYTLASLTQEDLDTTRFLCLVINQLNISGMNSIKNANYLRQKSGWECNFLVVGIGNRYNCGELMNLCRNENIDFKHTTDVKKLCDIILDWFENKQNVK